MENGIGNITPEKFTEQTQQVLALSQELVRRYKHNQWDVEHVLMALLKQEKGITAAILSELGIEKGPITDKLEEVLQSFPKLTYEGTQIYATQRIARLLDAALQEAERLKDELISTEHLFTAIVDEGKGESYKILSDFGITQEKIYKALRKIRGSHRVTDRQAESKYQSLEKYGHDLTQLAELGKLDPVIGREREVKRVIQILSRRTKNNPVLIGEAGVGKTAIAEGACTKNLIRRRSRFSQKQTSDCSGYGSPCGWKQVSW